MEELIHSARYELWQLTLTNWLNNEVLTPRWWGLVISLAVMYFVWWRLLDKSRVIEIMLYGSLVSVMAGFTDIVGITTASWQYNVRLFPIGVPVFPLDYSVVPLSLMVAYQFTSNWRSYVLASILASSFYGVFTSILEATRILSSFHWGPLWAFTEGMTYSFIARFVILWLKSLSLSHQSQVKKQFSIIPQPAIKPIDNQNDEDK